VKMAHHPVQSSWASRTRPLSLSSEPHVTCSSKEFPVKFLCLDIPQPGASLEKYQPHLREEARHAWQLYKTGIVRDFYFRQDPGQNPQSAARLGKALRDALLA
jgi:hypothetical protein